MLLLVFSRVNPQMLTRTSSEALSKQRVFMNAVDTGWINDENPLGKASEIAERHNYHENR